MAAARRSIRKWNRPAWSRKWSRAAATPTTACSPSPSRSSAMTSTVSSSLSSKARAAKPWAFIRSRATCSLAKKWHDQQRHASQGRGLRPRTQSRREQDAHHRRKNPPLALAGNLYRGRNRHRDRAVMKDFISIADCSQEELREFLDVAKRLKKQYKTTGRNDPLLAGKMLAMIFEKPSLRTRVSFAVAMQHLGGAGIMLRQEEVGLGQREAVKDVARVLSGMCDGVTIRTFDHKKVQELAHWSTIPVINALSDLSHPCQAMADLMTIEEHFGKLEGKTLAFIGDGNNVARALATACGRFGMRFILASP